MNANMNQSKFLIRAYMQMRRVQHSPPPPAEEIRRQVGWAGLRIICEIPKVR
jgi:hypothetical protein